MDDKAKAMVMGAFVGDSLALGVHWIYDTDALRRDFGTVDRLLGPTANSYHPTKEKGDFTHYGDQAMVLLESVAARGRFDLDDFCRRWRALFRDYNGYRDQATRATLTGFASGKGPAEAGSFSDELSGAARIAPIVTAHRNEPERMIEAARAQTRMTHNNPVTLDSAVFFAQTARRVLEGTPPAAAMEKVAAEDFSDTRIINWVSRGIASGNGETLATLKTFGQSCHAPHAFPGVIHLIAKYEKDLKEALIQSVMAGGDSAGRCMMTGMVLGAYQGWEALPGEWVDGLRKKDRILELLERIR